MKLRAGNPDRAGMSAKRVRQIVELAEGWVAQGIHSALVVLVARRGLVVLHEAYGRLGPEPDSPPLRVDTIFPLASLTKPITATAAMILVEDGLLGLNRPVQWYVPEFTGEGKDAVMVHHLLTHTSGLRDEDLNEYAEKKGGTMDIPPPDETQHPETHEYLHLRYDAPLWKRPGVEMSYADYNYDLLWDIVCRVSGQSLDDFARERIFGPLGMDDSSYGVPQSREARIVRRPASAPWAEEIEGWMRAPRGSDGAISTAVDMATFGQMFLSRGSYGDTRVLSPASVAEMTRNQIPGIASRYKEQFFPEACWGLGWAVRGNKNAKNYGTLPSARSFSHGGAGGVYLWVDPVYEIVGVYFSVVLEEEKWCADLYQNATTAAVVG